MIAFDTETFLIGPKAVAPKVVCGSFWEGKEGTVLGNHPEDNLLGFLTYLFQEEELVGHNVAYDLAVCCATWPSLFPLVFTALDEGRVHCTLIREKLQQLASHGSLEHKNGKQLTYSLAALAARHVGLDLSAGKTGEADSWRLNYDKLDGWKADEYPPDAHSYALLDAQATYEVWESQPDSPVEALHVKAAFALYLITAWGLKVDGPTKERLQAEVEAQLGPLALPLLYESGLVVAATGPTPYASGAKAHVSACSRKKGCGCPLKLKAPQPEKVRKKDVLVPLVVRTCKKHKIRPALTEKGAISTDKETLSLLAPLDPVLAQYQKRQELIKLTTSYFPALEWPPGSGQTAETVHPKYDPLKKTGRVSSRGNSKRDKNPLFPSVQIQQADPRVRSVYVPRQGYVYAVCDFSAIDLCSLAQTTFDIYGESNLRDQINAGVDPHSFLGSVLAYDGDRQFRSAVQSFRDNDEAVYAYFLQQKTRDPDWFKHWRTFAKPVGLGFPGGLGLKTMVSLCASYGLRIDVQQARRLRQIWYGVYPRMRFYLGQWVDSQGGEYVSPLGMKRAGCSYTELANGKALQTPAAEGMKEAMCLVTRACYDSTQDDVLFGSRVVLNMHDELVVEVKEDGWESERAERVSALMVEGMERVLKDVTIRAEPLLTRRWVKDAQTLRDDDGRLLVWSPSAAAASAA